MDRQEFLDVYQAKAIEDSLPDFFDFLVENGIEQRAFASFSKDQIVYVMGKMLLFYEHSLGKRLKDAGQDPAEIPEMTDHL